MSRYKKSYILLLLLIWAVAGKAGNKIQDSLAVYDKLDSIFNVTIDNDPVQALNICIRQTAIANIRLLKSVCVRNKKSNHFHDCLSAE